MVFRAPAKSSQPLSLKFLLCQRLVTERLHDPLNLLLELLGALGTHRFLEKYLTHSRTLDYSNHVVLDSVPASHTGHHSIDLGCWKDQGCEVFALLPPKVGAQAISLEVDERLLERLIEMREHQHHFVGEFAFQVEPGHQLHGITHEECKNHVLSRICF